jgi:hypothetical protein
MSRAPGTQSEVPAGPAATVNTNGAAAVGAGAGVALSHIRLGWWALLVFACVGLCLEGLHGFKVGYYLDPGSETRRLMWRLGHAHGVLLALVNIAFGVSLHALTPRGRAVRVGSRALALASLLMPVGFLAAGFGVDGGDPGLFIALVPLGGVALLVGLAATAWGLRRAR